MLKIHDRIINTMFLNGFLFACFVFNLTSFKRRQKNQLSGKCKLNPQSDITLHPSAWLKCWLECNTVVTSHNLLVGDLNVNHLEKIFGRNYINHDSILLLLPVYQW